MKKKRKKVLSPKEDRLIEKATRILMNRHKISEKEAMRRLQKASRNQRKKIAKIARSVISLESILN